MRSDKATVANVLIWAALTGYTWPQTDYCLRGWFGSKCEYRCRCSNDNCIGTETGECDPGVSCSTGWFGPQCQYVDLAYNRATPVEVTDGSDSTCVHHPGMKELNITFARPYLFTWLRLVFNSGVNHSVKVSFLHAATTASCDTRAHHAQSRAMDIHCYVNTSFQVLRLEGDLGDVCSVYVSGGRQIALKQRASQSSPYYELSNNTDFKNTSYLAMKAVDGDTNQDFYRGDTCSKTYPKPGTTVHWRLRFSGRRSADRYVLYFPHGFSIPGDGLTLEVHENEHIAEFGLSVAGPTLLSVHTILHRVLNMALLNIRTTAPSLELCEVEVYGDSVCPVGKYGRDCEDDCPCPQGQECFPSTGECHRGCPDGFAGETCHVCPAGRYGPRCAGQCSAGCARPADSSGVYCDNVNGTCTHGCTRGYTGLVCNSTCGYGSYGPLCNLRCSPTCAKVINGPATYCDPIDGTCIYGCQSGSMGVNCTTTCPEETYGLNCSFSCSQTCKRKRQERCDPVNGLCLHGCVDGYEGSQCGETCTKGYYGKDCSKQCPLTCSSFEKMPNTSCDNVNGSCLYGCVDGYVGHDCAEGTPIPSTAEELPSSPWNSLYILGLFSPLACIGGILLCKRITRKRASTAEEEDNTSRTDTSVSAASSIATLGSIRSS